MADDFEGIPGPTAPNVCDDCGHPGHFRKTCPQCGCPSGIERKKLRDAEHVAGHGDSKRPAQGFY